VIDAANTLYRAFFALPPLRAPDGTPTHAALGFVNMLAKVLREESPDHLVAVFDARGKTFRHELFPAYKATRDAQPEDLSRQFPLVRELVDAHRIPVLEVEGCEADDVIATLVAQAPEDVDVVIVSTDKDLMQLVGGRVVLLDTMKDRRFGPAEVEERFGVPPDRVLDLRALVGDPSDNIPGVRGIGEKGAAKLVREFGDLENLLAHAAEVTPSRARDALIDQAASARLSKRLAALDAAVPLPLDFDALRLGEPDRERLRALYQRLGFTRLLEGLDAAVGERAAVHVEESGRAAVRVEEGERAVATRRVEDVAGLAALAAELAREPLIALRVVSQGDSVVASDLVGLAFALGEDGAAYLPLGANGLDFEAVAAALGPLLASACWGGPETKQTQAVLAERSLELPAPRMDTGLAAFLLDPSAQQAPAVVARRFLGLRVPAFEDVAGRGARAVAPRDLPVEALEGWAGREISAARALFEPLRARLDGDGLLPLFDEVELPLTAVLARMERAGVRVDEAVLAELSRDYATQLANIEAEIYVLAGERFSIGSPKQLQRILFERLKLPVSRKTKTGFSTDEGVLEQLAVHHELPARILAHRRLAKLVNTYVDALPPLVDPRTGRVHPTFNQTGAATGRLSATRPNVQNIPIRSEEGVRIREAFVAAEGMRLLSADYSQVELRILAHCSEDPSLVEAFQRGEDIHRRTAAEVNGIDPADVSHAQRERAKAVNFGIIYGLSAFGLANQLGIAAAEAQATIDAYFERHRGVRRFLDETIASARQHGFVRTLFGRRRYLPDVHSKNRVLRNAAERMAVNSVIQGTAADLIKRAMVDVDAALRGAGLRTRMLLQVHDELVLEAPRAEVGRARELVGSGMEAVGASLRVPLRVTVGEGANWREAH
jgi:DNA polymerase-1